MKNLSECKEFYKDLYMDCLENDSFEKNIFESTEKARYETFCETLRFIYGTDFENIKPNWSNDALREFYSRKQSKRSTLERKPWDGLPALMMADRTIRKGG